MRLNQARRAEVDPSESLRRSVMSCMLWEDEFYEDGVKIADRIESLCFECGRRGIAELAIEARDAGLRHAPLLLVACLSRISPTDAKDAAVSVIRRADEMGELISILWRNGKTPIPRCLKLAIAEVFTRFDEYQLAKYSRGKITPRDVMFLTHPSPKSVEQAQVWKRLANKQLKTPKTWECLLSAGGDKKEVFESLIHENKLGYLALLRNLRGMQEVGVSYELVREAILARRGADGVFPYQFMTAAKACPRHGRELDTAMMAGLDSEVRIPGMTAILVDVSGSMDAAMSSKSEATRLDAAACVAASWPGESRIFTFSNNLVEVPGARRGAACVEEIRRSQFHAGTRAGAAVNAVNRQVNYDRIVVITDEQSQDSIPPPKARGYIVNIASNEKGVRLSGDWKHLDGFSPAVTRWIASDCLFGC